MYMSAAKIMLINEFLARHKDEIDPYEYEFIKKNLTHINGENFMYFPFVIREIFDKLGLLAHDANVYSRFADFVNELYAYDRLCTWKEELKKYYDDGYLILLDRYTTSSLIYQSALIEDVEERKEFINYVIDFEYIYYITDNPFFII